ncbi:hypothetical protein DIU36_19670 [Mucilaginibacter rubeus]|nr:hypothetical protein DIU36_19670 [Mucilaginibacter rubeus]
MPCRRLGKWGVETSMTKFIMSYVKTPPHPVKITVKNWVNDFLWVKTLVSGRFLTYNCLACE